MSRVAKSHGYHWYLPDTAWHTSGVPPSPLQASLFNSPPAQTSPIWRKKICYLHIFNQYSNIQNYLGNLNDINVWYVKVRKKNSGYLPGWRSILSYPSCVSLLFNFCSHRVRSGYIGISTLRWYILFVSWPHPIIFNLVKTILFFPFGYCNVTESKEMVSILFVGNFKFLFFMPFYILFTNKKRAL